MGVHLVKCAMFCSPGNLGGHVGLVVGKMHEQDIGQRADLPPRPDVFPERPERLAAVRQPVAEDESGGALDLFAGEADIAMRAGWTAPDDTFTSVWLQDHPRTAYCSPAHAAKRGVPAQISDLGGLDVVRLGGKLGQGKGNQRFMTQAELARSAGLAENVASMKTS